MLENVELITSYYAFSEAQKNLAELESEERLTRLEELRPAVRIVPEPPETAALPGQVELPDKDRPILLAAVHAKATHLLTGDKTHFGQYFGQVVEGVLILPPGDYLRSRPTDT